MHAQLSQLTLVHSQVPGLVDAGMGTGANVPPEEIPEDWENDA